MEKNVSISISKAMKTVAPKLKLGIITADVKVTGHNDKLWSEIDQHITGFDLEMSEIAKLSQITEARKVYRALGKDPTRYRLSSDSLMRRIVKSQGLYKVNDIVDMNNLLSLESGHSIGTYDLEKLSGDITYAVGTADEEYVGIGRGKLNIEGLPVLQDSIGSFGSATSDSERSMVTLETNRILMNIIAFDGDETLSGWISKATELIESYAGGTSIKTWIVD